MIVPTTNVEDETTKIGAAKVILSSLALFGITERTAHEGVHGYVRELDLDEN